MLNFSDRLADQKVPSEMIANPEKRDYIDLFLNAADNWHDKGVLSRETASLSSALLNYLSMATCSFADSSTATTWLVENGVDTLLLRFQEVVSNLTEEVDHGQVPGPAIGGNYDYLVFAHMAHLFKQFPAGDAFIRVAMREDVQSISTPFWCEYALAMNSLSERQSYESPIAISSVDLEKYWVCYLHLMERLSKSLDFSDVLAEVDASFSERNTDDSIKDDRYEIEGSGRCPVLWDFRRESLLLYSYQMGMIR